MEPFGGIPKEEYTAVELELIHVLSRIDFVLVNIIKGIKHVLNDSHNPDRHRQASNSIRHLTDILIRRTKTKMLGSVNKPLSEEQKELLKNLGHCFTQILTKIPYEIEDKDSCKSLLHDKYQDLNINIEGTFKLVPLTSKQVLSSYYGSQKDIQNSPEFTQRIRKQTISTWVKNHKYFTGASHYSEEFKEKEFQEKWETMQMCILSVDPTP
jgi:hypothetical protein